MLNSDTSISIKQYLNLLQLCDSAFPIGSFNHSYGMETYLRNNIINNAATFCEWMEMYLNNQYTYNDGLAISLIYDNYLDENGETNTEYLSYLDTCMTVQNVSRESREGAKLIASRMIDTILTIHHINMLEEYKENILRGECYGNPAIVFAITMIELDYPKEIAVISYAYSIIATMSQNAVRAIPLGQKDGQKILKSCSSILNVIYNRILELNEEDLGFNIPGYEISQMNHENLDFRLFMS